MTTVQTTDNTSNNSRAFIENLITTAKENNIDKFIKTIGYLKLNHESVEHLLSSCESSIDGFLMMKVILDCYDNKGHYHNIGMLIMKSGDEDLIHYFLEKFEDKLMHFRDLMYGLAKDTSISLSMKETIIEIFLNHCESVTNFNIIVSCIISGLIETNCSNDLVTKYLSSKHKYNLELITKNACKNLTNIKILLECIPPIGDLTIRTIRSIVSRTSCISQEVRSYVENY